jgi:hypothetical protein
VKEKEESAVDNCHQLVRSRLVGQRPMVASAISQIVVAQPHSIIAGIAQHRDSKDPRKDLAAHQEAPT